jgi:hypothetical protein
MLLLIKYGNCLPLFLNINTGVMTYQYIIASILNPVDVNELFRRLIAVFIIYLSVCR